MSLIDKIAARHLIAIDTNTYLEAAREVAYSIKDTELLYRELRQIWLDSGKHPLISEYAYAHLKKRDRKAPEIFWFEDFFTSQEFWEIVLQGRSNRLEPPEFFHPAKGEIGVSFEPRDQLALRDLRVILPELKILQKEEPYGYIHKFILNSSVFSNKWTLKMKISADFGQSLMTLLPPIKIVSPNTFEGSLNMAARLKKYMALFKKSIK